MLFNPATRETDKTIKNSGSLFLGFFGRFRPKCLDSEDSIFRQLIPALLLVIYSLIGAGIFYACEIGDGCKGNCTSIVKAAAGNDSEEEIGHRIKISFWEALYFVNTVHTTIGYGNVVPSTTISKIFTCIYSLVGIPLMVIVLNNLGKILAQRALSFKKICLQLREYTKTNKRSNFYHVELTNLSEESSVISIGEPQGLSANESLSIQLGFLILAAWLLISAGLFLWFGGDDWNFGDSFYFVFISVTTIGFGDLHPENYELVMFQFAVLLIGLALFSMCINIVQQQMEEAAENVGKRILKIYWDTIMNEGEEHMPQDRESAVLAIENLLKQQKGGRFLKMLLSRKAMNDLVKMFQDRAKFRNLHTQTDLLLEDKTINATVPIEEKDIQTEMVAEDKSVNATVAVEEKDTQIDVTSITPIVAFFEGQQNRRGSS